ncbi:MAG: MoaD/ThiS family protein [Candidatus Dormibacteraeota bacterium]|nr:MoaD/ThiS family protein [Candidatus Dormibacteraeota bacterium]
MRVTVLLFARPRELAGTGRLELDLPAGATASDAFDVVAERAPGLEAMRPVIRCAVGGEYAPWDTPLPDGTELALIPPTSGG